MANVFLIDDHPAVRHGLGLVLSNASHTICGEAGCHAEAMSMIESSAAQIVLLDISLGEENGLELVAWLGDLGIAVLVYSMHDDADTIATAFHAGADGYVSKREMAQVLLEAVEELLRGGRYVSPLAARGLAESHARSAARVEDLLSERESQILAMLGKGVTNAEIAAEFAIGMRTVETYFARIGAKLALEGTRELRRYAIRYHPLPVVNPRYPEIS